MVSDKVVLLPLKRPSHFGIEEFGTACSLGEGGELRELQVDGIVGMGSPLESVKGYLAHKKKPTAPRPPWNPRHRPTAGS
jgi:hypothetical protein